MVKIALEQLAMEAGVVITGVHSCLMADEETVSALFDCEPDESGCGLSFTFPLPQLVSTKEVGLFALWLAAPPDEARTVH